MPKNNNDKRANSGTRLNRNSPTIPPQNTPDPPEQKKEQQEFTYTKSFDGPSGRVPPLDAFDHVPRRMPPPHVRMQMQQEAEQRAKLKAQQQKKGKKKKKAKTAAQPKANAQQARQPNPANYAQAAPNRRAAALPNAENRQANQKRKPVVPKQVRRRRRILSILLLAGLIGGGLIFSFRMLFKINSFNLLGDSPYSKQQIMQYLPIKSGENLFTINKKPACEAVETSLPYIEELKISRMLPSTLGLSVVKAKETYYMPWNGKYAILSDKMKVLKFTEEEPDYLIGIFGLPDIAAVQVAPKLPAAPTPVPPLSPDVDDGGDDTGDDSGTDSGDDNSDDGADSQAPDESAANQPDPDPDETAEPDEASALMTVKAGHKLASEDEKAFAYLDIMLNALSSSQLMDEVNWISIKDTLSMQFGWQDRVTVYVGSQTAIEEKMAYCEIVLLGIDEEYVPKTGFYSLDVSSYHETLQGSYWEN